MTTRVIEYELYPTDIIATVKFSANDEYKLLHELMMREIPADLYSLREIDDSIFFKLEALNALGQVTYNIKLSHENNKDLTVLFTHDVENLINKNEIHELNTQLFQQTIQLKDLSKIYHSPEKHILYYIQKHDDSYNKETHFETFSGTKWDGDEIKGTIVGERFYHFPLVLIPNENLLLKSINLTNLESLNNDKQLNDMIYMSFLNYLKNDEERTFKLGVNNMQIFMDNEVKKYPNGAVVLNCVINAHESHYDIDKIKNYYKYLATLVGDYRYGNDYLVENKLNNQFRECFTQNLNQQYHSLILQKYHLDNISDSLLHKPSDSRHILSNKNI